MSEPRFSSAHFVDETHALYAGWVVGIGLRNGVACEWVVDDDGDTTNRISVPFGVDNRIVLVIPPPPPGWFESHRAPAPPSTPPVIPRYARTAEPSPGKRRSRA